MPEPAASSFLQTLADEHGVDELLFAGKSTAAPTEARVEAGSPGAPLGAAVSDGDAAGGNGHVEKPLEELPAAHDDLAMVRESLSKLAPEWLPSKLADGKGPLSQADINRRHGYTDFDDLDLGGELGVGGFSTVRVATNRSTGALFAVKSAPHKPGHDPTSASGKDDADMLCDEARVLHMLCHASVIHCYGIAIFPKEVLMVLELMEGGELFERIVAKPTHHYTEAGARKAAYVLLHAVEYLTAHGIVHRDLKPENLLLRSDSSDHDFKIADFGLAVVLSRPGDVPGRRLVKEYAGTPGYVAPEVYDACDYPNHPGYGAEADAWSCGAIIYALLGGYLPWPTRDMEKHKAQLRTRTVSFADASWEEVSPEATDLVRGLLDRDPYRRTKLAKALGAKWFEMDSNDLGRNTLYRCHVNFAQSLDQVNSLEERCTSGFGRHVHDAAEKEEVAVASSPVPRKGALHAWDLKEKHGYTTFEDLDIGEKLGEGGFAVVRLATNRVTKATFAVKEAPHKPGHDPNRDPDDADMLADEAKILRSLCHDTVIHCYDVVVRPEQCFVVLQLMRGGELFDRIVGKPNHHYTENEARKAAYVLLNAVAFLSDHGVVHRDLKPENLLLADDANDHDFKIADFGLAAILTDERPALNDFAGTPGYAAPEVYDARDFYDVAGYGVASDCWSCGALIFCLLGGYLPWSARDEEKMAANIRAQDVEFHAGYWDSASPEAKELIAGLLRRDPARRLSAAAALDCAWFAMDDTVLEYNKLHDVHDTLSVSHDHVQDTGHAHLRGVHVHDVIEAERLRKRADLLVRDIPDEVEVNLIFRGDFESANRGARQHTIGDAVFGCCAAGCGDAADAVYDMQAQARARR